MRAETALTTMSRPLPSKIAERVQTLTLDGAVNGDDEEVATADAVVDVQVSDPSRTGASSYWSAFGHMTSDNPHHTSFLNTVLPHPSSTQSPQTILQFTPSDFGHSHAFSGKRNPLRVLESTVEDWCEKNGGCMADLSFKCC